MPRAQTDARERILAIADELFYQEGIRATGVDRIIARSEVAKTTLYRYFPSKDDLVVAYLVERDRQYWALLEAAVAAAGEEPRAQLGAIFGCLDELLGDERSRGCPFLMVASEFPEVDYPGHRVAIAHKRRMVDRLTGLAMAMGIEQAAALAAGLMLLVDGAFGQRRLYGRSGQVKLEDAAAMLIRAYG